MKKQTFFLLLSFLLILSSTSFADKNSDKEKKTLKKTSLSGLSFRSIGPAITGGRISSIAVNPYDYSEYYVGSGHGSLWKTTNRGVTFSPVFDSVEPYAIGSIAIDPSNPNIIWVGTGENNNQNNVIYGDGIYRSEDGGKSWKNMGLKNSEHVTGIAIDPKNSDIVYAAAYGSLRNEGGDRGIYKTVDGGKTWKKVLEVSKYTGFYQVHMDPNHSNILYAVAHQRMRKLYTGVSGGPESGIYRTTDSGKTWKKLSRGLPSGNVGRIGMDISPANPDVVYAVVEATDGGQGFYRSTDRGSSWSKMDGYASAYKFYFQKIFADPVDVDRVYSMDVFMMYTADGGRSWKQAGSDKKHVDDHFLWINPQNNKHMINGCDGGVYETYDQGKNWDFKANLPITEIYKVSTDFAKPFYNVYFGTQDNNSLTGPSRTVSSGGITNRDWTFTNGGDGFETQVDWKDHNIVYAQSQNGGLVRFDKRSGENLYIKPADFGDKAYRFDWDAPLLISRHDNKRLYHGCNKVLRTDDQGGTWKEVSPDLTRGVPKKMLKLMGQSWSINDLARKGSMATLSSIAESSLDENVLFAGSADGLIHYTKDGGKTWKKGKVKGLPEYARIHHIIASQHDINVAYAACHNFVGGDKNPYLYKTTDGGENWELINGDLPKRGSTYSIQEDHVNKNLLFLGTQFGVYFTNNGGKEWIKLSSGIPTHAVMDLEIQREENDLVVSTFGRGVYILDDYTPLRYVSSETINKDAHIFPVKDAMMFIESSPYGFPGVGFQGASYYSAKNPEVGAVFTYYVKEGFETLKQKRRKEEKKLKKDKKEIKYPTYDQLKSETDELPKYLLFTITDMEGNVVRKIKRSASPGIKRLIWDFRYSAFTPVSLRERTNLAPWESKDAGYMVMPGKYKISLSKFDNGEFTELVAPVEFECKLLNNTSLPAKDQVALNKFNKKVGELSRAIYGANAFRRELVKDLSYFKKAVFEGADVPNELYKKILSIDAELKEINKKLNGDRLKGRYEGGTPTSVTGRIGYITYALWSTTTGLSTTFQKSYDDAASKFDAILEDLKAAEKNVENVKTELEKYGARYTPGRLPVWNK
ncbi:MAG: WD40/YVTN/BNR-like repeat-containing protein [Rhodothermaceae bacterium]